jgi:hypothetical protein
MAPRGYNPDDVPALRIAVATIYGLIDTAKLLDDRDTDVPSDLLEMLRSVVGAAKPAIPEDHAVFFTLPQLLTQPTYETVVLYGPAIARVLDEISATIERTHGAESHSGSPQVTVYVNPTDRKRGRQRHTRPPSGNADL